MVQQFSIDRNEESLAIRLTGRFDREAAGLLFRELQKAIRSRRVRAISLDFSDVTGIDSAGVALILRLEKRGAAGEFTVTCNNVPERIGQLIGFIRERLLPRPPVEKRRPGGFIARIGAGTLEMVATLREFVTFTGSFALAAGYYLLHPRKVQLLDVLRQIEQAGANSMLLVIVLSTLLGMIMVFQGLSTMGNIGPSIYIADMVGIAVLREMAPLLTSVIIAGRSGTAFAAEIGTMKLNRELDALTVMDFDLMGFLIIPRVLALIIVGPLLILLSDAAGIMGGLGTSYVFLHISPTAFMDEIRRAINTTDIYTGLLKGAVFAGLVAGTGCFHGLRTGMGPEGIGIQTTAAVVSGILLIVFADALFASIIQLYGW